MLELRDVFRSYFARHFPPRKFLTCIPKPKDIKRKVTLCFCRQEAECRVQESSKRNDQAGKIAKIYDQMIKEIMPVPQKQPAIQGKVTETAPIQKSKEEEKKKVPIIIDSFI